MKLKWLLVLAGKWLLVAVVILLVLIITSSWPCATETCVCSGEEVKIETYGLLSCLDKLASPTNCSPLCEYLSHSGL